jgi:hypothetical protein
MTTTSENIFNHMKLTTSTCDMAGCTNSHEKNLVVEFYSYGTPVLAACKDCNPTGWNMAAEAQKEMWLAGN